MQTSYLINHSLELRFALALLTACGLFAVVRLAYFLDEKLSAFFDRRQTPSRRSTPAQPAIQPR